MMTSQYRRAGIILALCAVALATPAAIAEVRLSALFGDNMVLQRGAKAPIWGWAKPGEKVVPKFITWKGVKRANVTTNDPRHMRTLFAFWVTSPKNPRFAEAIANRIWKKFFGIAVMEPVTNLDNLEDATNPQLLKFLGQSVKSIRIKKLHVFCSSDGHGFQILGSHNGSHAGSRC